MILEQAGTNWEVPNEWTKNGFSITLGQAKDLFRETMDRLQQWSDESPWRTDPSRINVGLENVLASTIFTHVLVGRLQ